MRQSWLNLPSAFEIFPHSYLWFSRSDVDADHMAYDHSPGFTGWTIYCHSMKPRVLACCKHNARNQLVSVETSPSVRPHYLLTASWFPRPKYHLSCTEILNFEVVTQVSLPYLVLVVMHFLDRNKQLWNNVQQSKFDCIASVVINCVTCRPTVLQHFADTHSLSLTAMLLWE